MPRYHFDTDCDGSLYRDLDGIDLACLEEARQRLAELLRDLTHYDAQGDANVTASAQVRCGGTVVLHGSCSLSINRPPHAMRSPGA